MLNMGIPMILSMALQAVYNIVDSAFVSNMKETGEAALNSAQCKIILETSEKEPCVIVGRNADYIFKKS